MSEEDKKPTAKDVLECLMHDLEITEDKEKYSDMTVDDLRECMANVLSTLIYMFELLSGGSDVNLNDDVPTMYS